MKTLLALAAVGEAATGLVLLAYPPIAVRLLFGAEIAGAGVVMSRFAGISLIALGLACWPGGEATGIPAPALRQCCATAYLRHCTSPIWASAASRSGACYGQQWRSTPH